MSSARWLTFTALGALALAPALAQERPGGRAGVAPVDSQAEAAAVASAASRLKAYLALTFDRSPSKVLDALTIPAAEPEAEPEAEPADAPGPEPEVVVEPTTDVTDRVSGTWGLSLSDPSILPEPVEGSLVMALDPDGVTITGQVLGEPDEEAAVNGALAGDVLTLELTGGSLGVGQMVLTLDGQGGVSGTLTVAGMPVVLQVTGARRSGGAAPTPAAAAPAEGAFATESEAFQRHVARGEWLDVGEVLATFPAEDGQKVYRHLLAVLGAPPGSQVRPGPDGPVIQPARPGPAGPLIEAHALSPADLRGLADASPGDLEDDDLDLLGQLLTAVIGQGHALDEALKAWGGGTARLGGEEPARRVAVARLLLAADRPREAGEFLPEPEATDAPKTLALLIRAQLGLHGLEPKLEQLEAAWAINQRLLQSPKLEAELRRQALAWAVDLAPRLREVLGEAWLRAVFQDPAPERGREVLGAIGAGVAAGRAEAFRDPDLRQRGLQLQRTAVDALLAFAPARAPDLSLVLSLLARNWLVEAELSRATDRSVSGGRPQPQFDSFGNIYFVQQRGNIPPNQPLPIATVEVLEVAPSASWRDLAGESLRAELIGVEAQLHLRAGEEDDAFPLIEALAGLTGQAERAHDLSEHLLRVWTNNHDLNNSGQRRNRYRFWGFEQRADAIPLTRSQQERNLVELSELLGRLRALPLEPVDEELLAEAFIRTHSAAEVYQLDSIQRVFGPPADLDPKTLSLLIQVMRTNLASLWRDPRVQKEKGTKRTDRELQAQVLRGYEVARKLARDGLVAHPQRWELLLADTAVRYDHADYQHRELRTSADYSAARAEALAGFPRAAEAYAQGAAELAEEDESNDVYDVWFAASLGACDLPRISHDHVPNRAEPAKIRAALEALPGEAAERHLKRFANSLFSRMSAVNPAVKFGYLRAGFEIVGEREEARDAKQVFDYYQDLVTEIALRTRLDGSSRVGHERPFGLFVEIRHTEQIERESGGFAKYLQNQNSQSFAWNSGRSLEDYRDKFEEATRALLEERFDVHSITFADPKVESRGDPERGWRLTPYAYVLLQARGPEVDEVPAISLDLDFLDTSGYAVLPVESAPLPIDARPAAGDPRPLTALEVTQSLDERRAGEGVLALEIQAKGRGLVPPLEDLLDMAGLDAAFEVASVDDPGVGAEQLDLEAEELAIVSTRRWLIELQGKQDLAVLPKTFTFPAVIPETQEHFRQRFADADLVEVAETVPLEQRYGKSAPRWPWFVLGIVVLTLVVVGVKLGQEEPVEVPPGPFAAPSPATPFAVLALLQRISTQATLDDAVRAELRLAIADLERKHFAAGRNGQASDDLAAVARGWVERGNALSSG